MGVKSAVLGAFAVALTGLSTVVRAATMTDPDRYEFRFQFGPFCG
ncbi:MAG TPA: hypothetical protein PKK06_06525 [Phycisphaerae bacterium]|nr:hypothetical protein [Phycisphaerae bacterium]HNU44498.1 hypothetical protein [Phycisphaerae bacterium]